MRVEGITYLKCWYMLVHVGTCWYIFSGSRSNYYSSKTNALLCKQGMETVDLNDSRFSADASSLQSEKQA